MNNKNIGIVVEFNPLHNGHKKLIDTIREENPDCNIIAVMSGNFVQRGELAIFDKWTRAEYAVEYGVDLVIEIPPAFVLNHANIFASKSIEILNRFNVTDVYFGSENLEIEEIESISNEIYNDEARLNELKKEYKSLPRAFEEFLGKSVNPNDTLGICYVLEAKKLNIDIKFHRVERKSNDEFSSASKIRKNIYSNKEDVYSLIKKEKVFNLNDYTDIVIGKLITSSPSENSLAYLKKQAVGSKCETIDELIEVSHNKGFTKSRLKRDLMRFTLELTGSDENLILATNNKGKAILKNVQNYSFRHTKENIDNYKVENFISIKNDKPLDETLSMMSIIK